MRYTPTLHSDATAQALPDTFKFTALCKTCARSRSTWEQMFTVIRTYHALPAASDSALADLPKQIENLLVQHHVNQMCVTARYGKAYGKMQMGGDSVRNYLTDTARHIEAVKPSIHAALQPIVQGLQMAGLAPEILQALNLPTTAVCTGD